VNVCGKPGYGKKNEVDGRRDEEGGEEGGVSFPVHEPFSAKRKSERGGYAKIVDEASKLSPGMTE
jgi:hypothetical protein